MSLISRTISKQATLKAQKKSTSLVKIWMERMINLWLELTGKVQELKICPITKPTLPYSDLAMESRTWILSLLTPWTVCAGSSEGQSSDICEMSAKKNLLCTGLAYSQYEGVKAIQYTLG
mmetsp:Transcript_469/g.516  ORF Transcript_469/g.516 Transcript_469/m.516 type:complete len:120 (-) Transcript_469:15-374(-)